MALVARRWRVGFATLADASIVPVAVGLALIRVGCFPALAFAASFLAFRVAKQLLRPASPDAALPEPAMVALYALAATVAAGWLAVRLRARRSDGAPDPATASRWAPGGA